MASESLGQQAEVMDYQSEDMNKLKIVKTHHIQSGQHTRYYHCMSAELVMLCLLAGRR